MNLSRYPKYKASGVEWLGDVPDGWKVVPCRNIVQEQTAKNDDSKCQDYLSLMANVGVLPYAEKGDVGNKKPEDLSKCKIVSRGDFVINSMNYGIGSYGLSNYDGICSPVYIVLKPKNDIVESRFAFRIFECRSFQRFAQSFGNGILEHRSAINWDILKSIGVGLPCLQEQKQILEFLDRETGKIDELVAEQRRLIELLKEKRQAVISHAVTKGLNPHAPMKPSGIEWLGDVPEHWEVMSIKRIVSDPITDGPHETPEFQDEGVPFVSAEAISSGHIDFSKIRGHISAHDNERYSRKYSPIPYDIYMVKSGATTGVTAIVEGRTDFNIWSPLAVIRCGKKSSPYFVLNFMRSRNFLEAVTLNWSFGTQQNIGMDVIGNLACTVPPLPEQTVIVKFLNIELTKLDTLTNEAHRAIDLLQERRTALISAAVTGQIDVRNSLRN